MVQNRTEELHCTENQPDLCYFVVGQLTAFKGKV